MRQFLVAHEDEEYRLEGCDPFGCLRELGLPIGSNGILKYHSGLARGREQFAIPTSVTAWTCYRAEIREVGDEEDGRELLEIETSSYCPAFATRAEISLGASESAYQE